MQRMKQQVINVKIFVYHFIGKGNERFICSNDRKEIDKFMKSINEKPVTDEQWTDILSLELNEVSYINRCRIHLQEYK